MEKGLSIKVPLAARPGGVGRVAPGVRCSYWCGGAPGVQFSYGGRAYDFRGIFVRGFGFGLLLTRLAAFPCACMQPACCAASQTKARITSQVTSHTVALFIHAIITLWNHRNHFCELPNTCIRHRRGQTIADAQAVRLAGWLKADTFMTSLCVQCGRTRQWPSIDKQGSTFSCVTSSKQHPRLASSQF